MQRILHVDANNLVVARPIGQVRDSLIHSRTGDMDVCGFFFSSPFSFVSRTRRWIDKYYQVGLFFFTFVRVSSSFFANVLGVNASLLLCDITSVGYIIGCFLSYVIQTTTAAAAS